MTTSRPHDSAHDAVERFIAGEDRLSGLLRDVPRYEAPEQLAIAVATAARAVQARVAVEAENKVDRITTPAPVFRAPETLSSSVQREAARIQAAQSARRDAVFDEVSAGKAPVDILGAPVSEATAAWLRDQAAQHSDAAPSATASMPPARPRQTHVSRWWKSLGLAASAFAIAGLATQIVLRQMDDGSPMTASLSSNVVIAEAPPMHASTTLAAREQTAPAAQDAPPASPTPATTPSTSQSSALSLPSTNARAKSARAPAAEIARHPGAESNTIDTADIARKRMTQDAAPTLPTPPASPASPAPQADYSPAAVTMAAPPAPTPVPVPTPAYARAQAAAPASMFAAPAPPAPAAAPAPATASVPVPAASLQAQANMAEAPGAASRNPSVVDADSREAVRRVPQSALKSAAPAPAKPSSIPAAKASTISIEDDPASVAMQWRPGKALHVWSAEPDNNAVRDWVARLWAAMPADTRPAAPYPIQRDDAMTRGQLRIEQAD